MPTKLTAISGARYVLAWCEVLSSRIRGGTVVGQTHSMETKGPTDLQAVGSLP